MKFSAARSELDAMIVEIELTLVSIIQGVALYFLIDNARTVLSTKQAIFWPYILAGLLVILIFWSRSVLHILTLIRWPLEFGHNFLYIACALAECLLFTRLTNPRAWFALSAIYGALGWLLFIYDLRLLRARELMAVVQRERHGARCMTLAAVGHSLDEISPTIPLSAALVVWLEALVGVEHSGPEAHQPALVERK